MYTTNDFFLDFWYLISFSQEFLFLDAENFFWMLLLIFFYVFAHFLADLT